MKRKFLVIIILIMLTQFVMPLMKVNALEKSKEEILDAMTTEEKVAQMLMPAFRQYDGNNVTQMNPKLEEVLNKYSFSGVILFSQNNQSTEQVVQLIDEMQKANSAVDGRPQLLIAVDQEGAGVSRLAEGTQGPGNMALGATNDRKSVNSMGKIIGEELNAIGYNVDFAPVVDVNNNPSNPIIGVRSISDDPEKVAEFGSEVMQGLMSQNIIVSLKHFPGHGDTGTDSHTGLPRIEKTYEELKQNELKPFEKCIVDGAEMIMTAHIQYPKIEDETYTSIFDGEEIELPATLSKTMITDILRNDLGYNGVVITDAMEMAAITKHFDKLDAAKLAINAGVDILLIPPVDTYTGEGIDELEKYIEDVAKMVDDGDISIDNVNNAVTRILKLKEKHGLLEEYTNEDLLTKIDTAKQIVGSKANHDKEWEIAKKSITLVKNDNNMLPIKENEKTVVMVPYSNEVNSAEYAIERLKEEKIIDENMDVSVYLMNGKELSEIEEVIQYAKNVIVISEQYGSTSLAGANYTKFDSIIEYVHSKGNKIAFISCYLPYEVARLQDADSILLAYSAKGMDVKPDFTNGSTPTYGVSIPAGIYMAFGENTKVTGKLPVNIPELDSDYKYTSKYLYERNYGLQYEEKEEYKFIKGEEQTLNITNDSNLTFEFNIDYDVFVQEGKVYIDNELVDSSNYALSKGSTIVTFNDDYTKSLEAGEHGIKVAVNDGKIETKFTIAKNESSNEQENINTAENTEYTNKNIEIDSKENNENNEKTKSSNPKTGDNIVIWVSLMVISMIGIAGIVKLHKKNK